MLKGGESIRVLYVCTGNSFRSPVAEALTKKYKPKVRVSSAGTHPASRISDSAMSLLENEDASMHAKKEPEPIKERVLERVDSVVVMEEDHMRYLVDNFQISSDKIKNWDIEDPINPEVKSGDAFEKIKRKVRSL